MHKKTILVATHNYGKLHDFLGFARGYPFHFVSLSELQIDVDVEEIGSTLQENALLKARFFFNLTKIPTISDDSGLEVDALGGEPGVYSRRYAGHDATDRQRIDYLLEKMKHVPDGERQARIKTVLACVYGPQEEDVIVSEGNLEGFMLRSFREPLLDGLPYISIFSLSGFPGKTVAELKSQGIMYPSQREEALIGLMKQLVGSHLKYI